MSLRLVPAALLVLLLGACVPSPTATPPRQTPFPTLPLMTDIPTPNPGETEAPGEPTAEGTQALQPTAVPQGTAIPTHPPATVPRVSTATSLVADTVAPIVLMTVQDPTQPVSTGQTVPVNVLAADNIAVVRLAVYDNNALIAEAPALTPSAVYSNQFLWPANVPGRHTLRAIAYDASGNASAPAQLELAVINNNRPPAVQITAPSGTRNAELGAPLLIQGVATDDVGITRMELVVDNQLVTYVLPDKPAGITPFAVAIPWTPLTTGTHNVILRAFDNQGASDDSLRTTIHVFDNQPPVVTAKSERRTVPSGDALVVHALALSNNGVARVELYVDGQLADTAASSTPAQQTALAVALAALDTSDGAHSFFVRAYDLGGLTADTPATPFTVNPGAARVLRETPVPSATRAPVPATPTPTPTLVLPDPPSVQVGLAGSDSQVVMPNPAKIQVTAHGSTELDHIQVWARYPGELIAQLVTDENVQGATDKTFTFDWNAPHAGVIEMYARVTDNLGQTRLSALYLFEIQPPPAPLNTPPGLNLAQTWVADSPATRFEVTFFQIGRAVRGGLVEKRADGSVLHGNVISGVTDDKTVWFGVDFVGDATAPDHTLVFDCALGQRPPQLTCNYTNENGDRGSAIFAQALQP